MKTLGEIEAESLAGFANPQPTERALAIERARHLLHGEGREAFEQGLGADACPYGPDKPHARKEWGKGYGFAAALAADPGPDEEEPEDDDETDTETDPDTNP